MSALSIVCLIFLVHIACSWAAINNPSVSFIKCPSQIQ
jgi:hypothetical protein